VRRVRKELLGGAERDRTDDLRLAKPALSQLSYGPRCYCQNLTLEVVGQGRVELPTSRLSGVRSNHLSYWPGAPRPRGDGIGRPRQVCLAPWKLNRTFLNLDELLAPVREQGRVGYDSSSLRLSALFRVGDGELLRKEVIQPQVPLRLPCYDFTPVTVHSLGPCLSCELA
jgi:hypothetical protein